MPDMQALRQSNTMLQKFEESMRAEMAKMKQEQDLAYCLKMMGMETPTIIHPVDPTVCMLYAKLNCAYEHMCIAGGYASYLFGFTSCFGDIDLFIRLPSECKSSDPEYSALIHTQLAEILPNGFRYDIRPEISLVGTLYAAFVVVDVHQDGSAQKIQLIFSPNFVMSELIDTFDLNICKNAIFLEEGEWITYSRMGSLVIANRQVRARALVPDDVRAHWESNKRMRNRANRYAKRLISPKLKRLSLKAGHRAAGAV